MYEANIKHILIVVSRTFIRYFVMLLNNNFKDIISVALHSNLYEKYPMWLFLLKNLATLAVECR